MALLLTGYVNTETLLNLFGDLVYYKYQNRIACGPIKYVEYKKRSAVINLWAQ